MPEDEKSADGLDKRVPQDEGAKIDHRLYWSGRISPAEPSDDVELMERVRDCLRDL